MVILDENGAVVDVPDYEKGHIETETMPVTHKYVIDTPEAGHWHTVAEYPDTGGADVEWVVDVPESGHWETVDGEGRVVEHYDGLVADDWPHDQEIADVWQFGRYVEYTPDELAAIAKAKAEAEAAAKRLEHREAAFDAMLDSIAPTLTDDQASAMHMAFPEWEAGAEYAEDILRRDGGKLWRCTAAHTSSKGDEPGKSGDEPGKSGDDKDALGGKFWQNVPVK